MMKQLRLLFTMLMLTLLGGNAAWAASVDITPQQALNGGVTPITVACEKGDGTSNPAISSGQLRLYQAGSGKTTGNTITFSSDYTITSIEFTFANGMTADNGEFSEGDYNAETTTWNGSTNSVTLTVTGTKSGERIYITAMTVTYEDGGAVTQKVATPTFNPGEGSFTEAQDVEISTTTEDATIYYTTDGSTPTEESTEYTGAITIEETTTIKAIAVKDGMNDSDVATATYTIVSAGDGWVETSLDDLTGDDVFVIVGNNGNDYAMSNENGTNNPPSAVSVTIVDDKLIGTVPDNIKWNISGDAASGYTFYPNGSTETWLYCTNTNNGVRVGDNNNKTFKLQDDYLYHTATSRYVGIYSSQDWRCYGSINSNIQDQSFKFYKNPTAAPAVAKPTFSPAGGEYTEALSVTISCTTEGATIYYTTDGSTPTDESTEYTEAIAVSETTTIKAIAYVGTDASSVATAVYTITLPLTPITIAEARAQGTDDVFTAGTVTSVNGKTAYIQDNTAAIVVFGNSNLTVTVGDAITVQGTLDTYNGLLEIKNPTITVTSQGNEVTPDVMDIADISNDNQAKLIKIEEATVTTIDNKTVTIEQDGSTINVYFNNANDITFAVGAVITLTGNIGCFNTVQIANPRDITVKGQKEFTLVANNVEYPFNGLTLTQEFSERVEFSVKEGENNVYGAAEEDLRVIAENHENLPLVEGGSNQFYITKPNTWKFTITEDAEGNVLLTVVPANPGETKYMIADEYLGESEDVFVNNKLTKEMTTDAFYINRSDDYGVSELTAADRNDAEGYFIWEFSEENNSVGFIAGERRNMYRMAEAGTYTFTLDFEANTVTAVKKEVILPEGDVFVKVTSSDDIEDGYYLIVYETNNVAFNGGLEALDAVSNTIAVEIENNVIEATDANKAAVFAIEGGSLKSISGYYIGVSSNSNGLKQTEEENTYGHEFSIDDDGNAVIFASFDGSTMYLRFNKASNQDRFRYYKNAGQEAIALYKLTTAETVSVEISSAEYATLYYSDKALEIPEGVTAQIVTGVSDKSIEFENLDGIIPAGTGVVLNGPQGTYDFKVVYVDSEAPVNNKLKGYDAPHLTEGGDKYYKLTVKDDKVGFYWGEENGEAFESGAHKAYLALRADEAKEMGYFFDGLVTEIRSIGTETVNGEIYTIGGVRVKADKLQKGIYIVNGKKMVVK